MVAAATAGRAEVAEAVVVTMAAAVNHGEHDRRAEDAHADRHWNKYLWSSLIRHEQPTNPKRTYHSSDASEAVR